MGFRTAGTLSAILLVSAALQACNATEAQKSSLHSAAPTSASDGEVSSDPEYDPARLSCDPFGGAGPTYFNQGLKAELFYLEQGQSPFTRVSSYLAHGRKLPADLFFSDLNVPTRLFSAGFPSQAGPALETADQQILTEHFGLRYRSVLRLSADDRASKYQFAVLSDDGSILRLDADGDGTAESWIDNDGDHPSRVACASKTVWMDGSTHLPLELDYYQGPRHHIALMLLWREIPMSSDETHDPSVLSDASCGVMGNDVWFDYTRSPSLAKAPFIQMLDRGWKILNPGNFLLPNQIPRNPCCTDCTIGV